MVVTARAGDTKKIKDHAAAADDDITVYIYTAARAISRIIIITLCTPRARLSHKYTSV